MAEIVNLEFSSNNIDEIRNALTNQIQNALESVGIAGENFAKTEITASVYNTNPSWYVRTGRLRNSLTHEVDMESQSAVIGTNVEYAVYVEMGTGIYVSGGRQSPWMFMGDDGRMHRTSGMQAKPYLKPALENHTEEYKSIIENALRS